MKIKNIIISCFVAGSLYSCYEDLGNYTYHDINEIKVSGISDTYSVDVDDSLKIVPSFEGTMYADTSMFTYKWEIDRRVKGNSHDLNLLVDLLPGEKNARFVITDKSTGHNKYHLFKVIVSSSTAGDLLMVLSKTKGKAELSYLRLDKPSNFAINYYEDRFGKVLGYNPKQLHIRLCEAGEKTGFANYYGKVMVLVDEGIKLIDKMTMMPDTVNNVLTGESYTGTASYPKPDIEGYKSEFIADEGISMWRDGAYGLQLYTEFNEISNGALYFCTQSNRPSTWATRYVYKKFSPYNDGPLSPFAFFDDMSPTPHGGLRQAGFSLGQLVVFDYKAGRFAYATTGSLKSIPVSHVKEFSGYNMVYGSSTIMSDNTSIAVLRNGNTTKMLLMTRRKDDTVTEGDKNNVYNVAAELTLSDTRFINEKTKFYTTVKGDYMFFATGDKLYRYNMLNIKSSVAPSEADVVAKLGDFGYDSSAEITSLFVSRSEMSLLLGVSRYGADTEAMDDEAKGDILGFSLNNAYNVTHNPSVTYKGIAGIPVDVKVKYSTNRRYGLDLTDKLIDNI